MTTSAEVFAKRKQGDIEEAYRMALELMGAPRVDNWDRKAFCWCLVDLIKRDAKNGNSENLPHYRRQLESVETDPSDDVLAKGIRYALSLCNPGGQQISQARALSREGKHAESAAQYRKVLADGFAERDTQTGFGWELYHHCKELLAAETLNLGALKRNLNEYLKLDVEKPSDLHSRMLQQAAKLAGQDKFSMLVFSRLWNLEYLRPEDFERYRAADGKEYPSLAERVIQQAGKEAAASDNAQEQRYILPHIDAAISRFPDNIWLLLDKAKVLLALGMRDEALKFGLAVAKAKSHDYWAWGLLGDIISRTDQEAALGCYCKALSCSADDKFTGKIRLKVALRMIEQNNLTAAKREIESIVQAKEKEGHKIPDAAAEIIAQSWFADTPAASSNHDFYKSHLPAADALLFGNMPWIDANVGDGFVVLDKENKPRQKRRIFIKTSSAPRELVVPEQKLGRRNLVPGSAIRIKGEFDGDQHLKIFIVEHRDVGATWDVFPKTDVIPEKIGVVDHVNNEKRVLHFMIDREINGIIPLAELTDSFVEGDAIALKLSPYLTRNRQAYRVHEARATREQPSEHVKKLFCEEVRVSNGMGFTDSDIFIASPLVKKHQIQDGTKISGTALLNFNKKRGAWGWKAIAITNY